MIKFTDEQKIKYFDEICQLYYNKNFGLASKSEIDLLFFKFYYEALSELQNGSNKSISDYVISKDLAITQTRVRNYRVKKELVYPSENQEWKENFLDLVHFAYFDKSNHKVTMSINDPILYIELENYIEENNMYFEKQLNQKNFTIRVEYFIELLLSMDEELEYREVIENLKKKIIDDEDITKPIYKESLGKVMIEKSVKVGEVICLVETVSPMIKDLLQFIF